MIEELISRVFYARNLAHFVHWTVTDEDNEQGTGSYAKHKALGNFYDDVIEALDDLVEAYQGAFKLVGSIPAPKETPSDVLKALEADAKWIEEHHENICKGNRAVANLIDTLTGVYLSTIYKLRNLK
jgi:DNA-binding ferritin-like protein